MPCTWMFHVGGNLSFTGEAFGLTLNVALQVGMLGEMLSGALNIIGFSWVGSPAATELETVRC